MLYEELYVVLGKLFYYVAAVDGKVQAAERELRELITSTWKPLENSVDEFVTDRSVLIDSSFDYEESESFTNDGLQSFEEFYKENKDRFTPVIIGNILKTANEIASAFYGENKDERMALEKTEELFHTK